MKTGPWNSGAPTLWQIRISPSRQALPAGTQVRAGGAGLDKEVTWATRLRPVPPAFGHLNGGEVVFLSTKALELVDERLTLESAVRQLAGFGVAAVGFL